VANLTLAIPSDVKLKMDRFPEINWSEVARQAIQEKMRVLDEMTRLLSKSRLSEEDTISIGRQIKRQALRKHKRAA
jgi:hypothetical protein